MPKYSGILLTAAIAAVTLYLSNSFAQSASQEAVKGDTPTTKSLCFGNAFLPGTKYGVASIRYTEWHEAGSDFIGDTYVPPYNVPQRNLPAYCRVLAEIETSSQSAVRFEVWFPETEAWKERLLVSGNGGWAGGLNYPDVAKGLRLGFASVGTDAGHNSSMADGSWMVNHERWVDFAHRAVHLSTSSAKTIVSAFYGFPAKYSYIYGCSTGGRMGMISAQMYPEDFDGILSGCPVLHHSHLESWEIHVGRFQYPRGQEGYISSEVWGWVHEEALRQCDALDGVTDGLISNPSSCDLDLSPLLCSRRADKQRCLSPAQLTNLQQAYTGWILDTGEVIYDGMEPGGELTGIDIYFNSPERGGYGNHFFRYGVLNDLSWDLNIDVSHVREAFKFDIGDAWSADLSAFYRKGGKIMHYHGLQDSICTSRTSRRYYGRVLEAMQQKGAYKSLEEQRAFYRLFLVPGLAHCGRGDGAWAIGGANQDLPLRGTPEGENGYGYAGDALMTLVSWVEGGTAPEKIVCVKYKDDDPNTGVLFSRPTCAYPALAKLVEGMDKDDQKSWVCEMEGVKEEDVVSIKDRKWIHDEL